MQRDARAFLWDAHSAAEATLEFVAGKTYTDYSGDRLLCDNCVDIYRVR